MDFKEAITILNIKDYGERIFNSNSNGSLFHLLDYIVIAKSIENDCKWFRDWFEKIISNESSIIFQHVLRLYQEEFLNQKIITKTIL